MGSLNKNKFSLGLEFRILETLL